MRKSRMDNPEALATLYPQDTGHGYTNKIQKHNKENNKGEQHRLHKKDGDNPHTHKG